MTKTWKAELIKGLLAAKEDATESLPEGRVALGIGRIEFIGVEWCLSKHSLWAICITITGTGTLAETRLKGTFPCHSQIKVSWRCEPQICILKDS